VSFHVYNIGSLDDVQQFLSDRRKQWKAKHERHDSHGNVRGHDGRHKVQGKRHGGERYDPASKEDGIASNTVDEEMEPDDDEEEQGHCRTPAGDWRINRFIACSIHMAHNQNNARSKVKYVQNMCKHI
jgi:hypothetical protein